MEPAEYQARAREEATALREAAVAGGPDVPVPTCPGWTTHRLVQHVDRVLGMVSTVLRAADPAAPPPRRPPVELDFVALLDRFDTSLAATLDLLASTDPDAPAWVPTPTALPTAAFWSRRLAHELTVHRIDAQAAAGTEAPVDPAFAADGVDEALTRMLHRPPAAWANAEYDGTVLFHAADAGQSWTVRLAPGQLPQTTTGSAAEPDASVVGLADAVYRTAWGRPSGAVVKGDGVLLRAAQAR